MLDQEVRGMAYKFRIRFPEIWLKKQDGRKRESVHREALGGDRIKEEFCLFSKMREILSWMIR